MAFGVISTSVLLSLGVSPANASAVVHGAKVFTGAASGASHIFYKNVDWRLLALLAGGGVLGGTLGAYVLTSVPGEAVKPYVVGWLGLMGLIILYRAWRQTRPKVFSWRSPFPLGLVGGFFDAIGGGGWGPIVTTTLLSRGNAPRTTIGTVNAAEFLVALAASGIFTVFIGITGWPIIIGLIIGGVLAAPLGAWMAKIVSQRFLLIVVGCVIIVLSAKNIFGF